MENLIKEAKMGNPDAFAKLMQSQMQNMYKAARSILYSDEDIADAISDTILTCWEKLSQLNHDQYFRTWMTRILINKCNDILRKQKHLFFSEELPDVSVYDTQIENMEWQEALNSLDEKYRLVMILYYVEGFKTSEISQILEISESTVRGRLSRGRAQLAEEYISDRRKTV